MRSQANNFAYIDGANLHNGMKSQGWNLDYSRFRVWLRERYGVTRAFIFLGMISRHAPLYAMLQNSGYELIFKQTTYDETGKIKGNCDVDLAVEAMRHAYEKSCDQAVLVSSDGDYVPLIRFLLERRQMRVVLSPSTAQKCSILLKRLGAKITFLSEFKNTLVKNKEAPDTDGTV